MKSSRIRSISTALFISAFALVMSASAADQAPPGDLVTPTLGGADIQGVITNSDRDAPVNISDSEGLIVGQGSLDVRGGIKNSAGDVVVNDNLDIQGNVTATQVGKFFEVDSAYYGLGPNASNSGIAACPAGSQVISCGSWITNIGGQLFTGPGVSFGHLTPSVFSNGCLASFYNETNGNLQFRVRSVCFDPSQSN